MQETIRKNSHGVIIEPAPAYDEAARMPISTEEVIRDEHVKIPAQAGVRGYAQYNPVTGGFDEFDADGNMLPPRSTDEMVKVLESVLEEMKTPSIVVAGVPERLRSLGNIYDERSKVYGDNYKHFGKVMLGCFPRGITLQSEKDFTRFCIFVQKVSKLTRYAQSFAKGHPDSLDDTSVYSQMLAEVDDELRAAGKL